MKQELYQSISDAVAEDTSIFDLAEAVAKLIIEEYGEHNYKHFVETVCKTLSTGIEPKIAMEILRANGYYSTNLWHIDDIVKTFDNE